MTRKGKSRTEDLNLLYQGTIGGHQLLSKVKTANVTILPVEFEKSAKEGGMVKIDEHEQSVHWLYVVLLRGAFDHTSSGESTYCSWLDPTSSSQDALVYPS